jgi:CheY-like chemotaxis protein
VVVLTTSVAEEDILRSYALHANAYVTKPVDLDQLIAVKQIDDFVQPHDLTRITAFSPPCIPPAVLRSPDRTAAYTAFVADLKRYARAVGMTLIARRGPASASCHDPRRARVPQSGPRPESRRRRGRC